MQKAIRYLYYLLFLLVPIVLWPYTSEVFEFNKTVVVYVLTTLITASWIIRCIITKKIIFRRTILDIPIVVFIICLFFSTIFSIDPRTSLFGYYSRFNGGLLSIISYFLLYWAYVANMDAKSTIKAISVLLSSAVIVSIYGVLEHFGIDKNIWVQDVQNRVFSSLGQPNWLAAWLVCLIPISWALYLKKDTKSWIFYAISTLFFLTLLFTKSRSGLLGFVIADIIFWVILLLREKKQIVKKAVYVHLTFVTLVAIFGTPWSASIFKTQIQPTPTTPSPALETGGTESGTIRKIVWKGAVEIWKHYPILGSGVETFAFSYYKFRPTEHNLTSEWDFIYNKAHNE
ncbi:O-antigen ligase family protein, partial [Patescibacteria group bacterium]